MGAETRASLLMRVRDPRDQDAWRTFFDIYAPLIMRWCHQGGLQQPDAEDVTQNVLKSVASAMRNFEYQPQKGMFRSWLLTAVRREISRSISKNLRPGGRVTADSMAVLTDLPADALPADEWTHELAIHVYQNAKKRVQPEIPQRQWAAFELLWERQRSPQDVAKQLGEDVGWVYKAKFNVIQRLKAEVRYLAEDLPAFT